MSLTQVNARGVPLGTSSSGTVKLLTQTGDALNSNSSIGSAWRRSGRPKKKKF